ncbi:hypothetical protein BEL04_11670 [Mucilaginibacter sp. PPCGB 2223]|uniref:hypothetical protein n=1 Tax=Mucilaginibacter sp. PPCGB 2223 TaxID=1886027 RepID=UPI00082586AA|nr:hypothetical protein [Mucilaginibacter sp. PPCGB 2223]OCX52144.1 hypothetical protein BEL04_11670 [Mucilaginibacter sp. PPCGB 2223]
MSITKAILIASDIPVLLVFFFMIARYRYLENTLKVFWWFIMCSAIVQIIALVLWLLQKNNLPLLHFYVPVGFALLVWYYKMVLAKLITKRVINAVILLFVCFSIVNSIFFQGIFIFNSNALTVESILLIILSIFTFIVLLNQEMHAIPQSVKQSLSWINSGVLIYYASTLLLFYFANYCARHYSVNINTYDWLFHSAASITMYICFFVGIWKQVKEYR